MQGRLKEPVPIMQTTQKSKTDIVTNCFCRGGGMENYTFDPVRGLRARGVEITVYAAQVDSAVSGYNRVEIHRINQQTIPKKLRPYFFIRQLVRARRGRNVSLVACNPGDHTDIFVRGGTYLGYLHNMGERPGLLDRPTTRRNRSNYATVKSIMAHSHLIQRELTALYGAPPEKIRIIYLPADTAYFRPVPDEAAAVRAKYGFRDDETVSLFPSTGHKRKGLDLLADLFEHTNLPVKLAVAGLSLLHPVKSVVGLGLCTNMSELYRAADLTVMVSLYEPFELAGVEPVLYGTYAVLFDNMACTEVMNDEADFFPSRSRPETLVQVVIQAVALKQQGRHRIAGPMQALAYNPTLEYHIDQTITMPEVV